MTPLDLKIDCIVKRYEHEPMLSSEERQKHIAEAIKHAREELEKKQADRELPLTTVEKAEYHGTPHRRYELEK